MHQLLTTSQVAAYLSRLPQTIEHESMARHTSLRLGGPARLYAVAESSDILLQAVEAALELEIPWYVFSGGSNLLVADAGYEGVVIQAAQRGLIIEDTTVRVESGAITALVARRSVEAGLTGFEWAVGLPGTIGGAIYGNAGCFGGEMREAVESVDAFRLRDRVRLQLPKADCHFSYRDSVFKHEPHVILGCTLKLAAAEDPVASKTKLEEIMRHRRDDQPLGQSSAGCIFKNVEVQDDSDLEKLAHQVEVPSTMRVAKRLSAGWLIEQAGLKGRAVGAFEVSPKHGNFFVNTGSGQAKDAVTLIALVKQEVRERFGLELEEEVQLLGF